MEPRRQPYNPEQELSTPPAPEPAPAQPQAPTPVEPKKVPRHKQPIGWAVLTFLLLAACGALGYFLYTTTMDSTKSQEQLTASKAKVSDLETRIKALSANAESDDDMVEAPINDQEAIVETVMSHIRAQPGNNAAELTVKVTKIQGKFATASVTMPSGVSGYGCVLVKSVNVWLQLYCGQSMTEDTKQLDILYGVPKNFLQG